ncbi:EI24 domain-containing protein [Scleromatobacter humisilvae]|uniref:EI24 domain-containing protein n=1 Tax=Scleromatobacter humisilvae TaxID=2897159 RepID=A0A9X2C3R6_9BURK|nr:EI24 domain-containing protein [Scleromatobacter humisilvae]MCK9688669.1 EI24 domain-containing protein [Scleromatobacter humisilvae]
MKSLFGSFWRAVAYCLHPRVIALSLLPLLVAGAVTLAAGYLFWESAIASVRATLEHWSLVNSMLEWMSSMLGANFRTGVAALIVIALTIPVVVAMTLVLVGLWITPAIVTLVARRRFPALERRHGGSWWLGIFASLAWTVGALLMVMITLPFWLVPGLALVLPPLIWGWLTAKVMGFDALAEHASQPEREAILRAHRWPLLIMGIVCGFLCGVPSMIWTLSMQLIIFAPFIMVGVIWLYTMIFTFSALWFTHYGLGVLATLRDAESAMRAVQPAVVPSSDLQLVEEVPPHERFGYEDSRPLEP